ncbi:hypothetical protein Ddye_003102, partial [Dipteronia dyeriana]
MPSPTPNITATTLPSFSEPPEPEPNRDHDYRYKKVSWSQPKIRNLAYKCISVHERELLEKVWEALNSCDGNKALVQDGFNINFIKAIWKGQSGLEPTLAATQKSQTTFVRGLQILDSFMVASEIINNWRRDTEDGILVKLDFKKAYDNVDHSFLDDVLLDMRFG